MFSVSLLCVAIIPCPSCHLQMVLYKQTGILPSGKKMIPKQKFGRDEQLSGRTSRRPCSFLGSNLSQALLISWLLVIFSFLHPSQLPVEIKAPKCFHISLVPSLCQCSRVWLRLTFFLWRYQVTWL